MNPDPKLFSRIEGPNAQQALFAKHVKFVEVEIFSYCNRVCGFCTNSIVSRRGPNNLMDPMLYSRIMGDLASVDYSGVVWYSRYNEPTANREIFLDRVGEAREALPKARLQTYTNGDYLDAEYIHAIRDAGLNELRIMAYAEEQTETALRSVMLRRVRDLGLPAHMLSRNVVAISVEGMAVTYQWQFLFESGTNRGGALPTGGIDDRQSPCAIPSNSMYIDWDGSVVPCCDIRSDIPMHQDWVVGKLGRDNSIFDVWANGPLVDWRRSLMRWGSKQSPCSTCNRGQFARTPETERFFDEAERICAS